MKGDVVYSLKNLVIDLHTPTVSVRAVDGVSLDVREGETLAIVGESGSGKTVMTLGPLGLLPEGVAVDMRGAAVLEDFNLVEARHRDLTRLRGRNFGVIFQDPMSALNPMLRVGPQLASQARRFLRMSSWEAKEFAVSLLARTGIPDPKDRYNRYPHEMSGGMLQRVMIAMALSTKPRVLVADEPTTALDATVQAQILELLRNLQDEEGISVVMITHDIGAVSAIADRVVVLYAGRVAEEGTVEQVLTAPCHPYTRGLLASVPDFRSEDDHQITEIPGLPPNQLALRPGCQFADRCPEVVDACRTRRPALVDFGERGHRVACPVVTSSQEVSVNV